MCRSYGEGSKLAGQTSQISDDENVCVKKNEHPSIVPSLFVM